MFNHFLESLRFFGFNQYKDFFRIINLVQNDPSQLKHLYVSNAKGVFISLDKPLDIILTFLNLEIFDSAFLASNSHVNIKLQLWLEEGISDYKYLTYLGHKDLQIIKNIEEKYSPDLKLFAKNILLSTFKFSKRDFINITLVTLTFTPINVNPVTFRMNVVEAFIYKSIYWPLYHTKLSFDEFKVNFGFDSSYLYSLATILVTPFNSMELYKITILPKKTAK